MNIYHLKKKITLTFTQYYPPVMTIYNKRETVSMHAPFYNHQKNRINVRSIGDSFLHIYIFMRILTNSSIKSKIVKCT